LSFPYSELDLNSLKQVDFSELNFEKTPSLLNQEQSQFNFLYWEKNLKKLYDISDNDIIRISDTVSLSIDLFHKQEKSAALYPVLSNQPTEYAKAIVNELNDFLDEQDIFVNAKVYDINRFTPLMMIKLSFDKKLKEIEK
jgi:hypothetical protein